MDPLHPLVPIQPPAPMPPTYNRVERIERDPQGDSGPDWQRNPEDETEEDEQQQFEDDYDPEWSDPAAVEPYGPDGVTHEAATGATTDPNLTPAPEQEWNPRIDGERRSHARDEDDDPGPHIDISA
jgi:hypothetical protein